MMEENRVANAGPFGSSREKVTKADMASRGIPQHLYGGGVQCKNLVALALGVALQTQNSASTEKQWQFLPKRRPMTRVRVT